MSAEPNVFLLTEGRRIKLAEPYPDADHAVLAESCPKCGDSPCKVVGSGSRFSEDDRAHEADGYCVACREFIGVIRFEPSTIFGVREDNAVLNGRPRVY